MRRGHLKGRGDEEGFSLLEVMVAGVILAVAVVGTGYFFVSGEVSLGREADRQAALLAARAALEKLRALPSSDLLLEGTPPPGRVHLDSENPILLDDRGTSDPSDDLRGYRRWVVTDLDDPADGQEEGAWDYREVTVEVASSSTFEEPWVRLRTLLAP